MALNKLILEGGKKEFYFFSNFIREINDLK